MSDDIFKILSRGHNKNSLHKSHPKSKHGKYFYKHSEGEFHANSNGMKHHNFDASSMLEIITKNKFLLVFIVLLCFSVLAICALVVVALLSMSGPIIDFIAKSGMKGVVDYARSIAQIFWEGSGK